jgi:glycosyltransferase involved in cell wall biosynthesis
MITENKQLLTVIIPTNNLSRLRENIERTLRMASDQGIETILVVDQEFTSEVESDIHYLEKLGLLGLKIIVSDKRSPGGARNVGLAKVQTTWVAFWDSDDEPQVGAFQKMVSIAESNPAYNVAVGNFLFIGDGRNTSELFGISKDNFEYSLAKRPGLWRFAFRISRISSLTFHSSKLGEDQLFLAQLNLNVSEIFFSEMIVYKYFSGNPLSLTTSRVHFNDLSIVYRELSALSRRQTSGTYCKLMSARIAVSILKSLFISRGNSKLNVRELLRAKQFLSISKSIVRLVCVNLLNFRKTKPRCVTVHLAGGLGNQLFQLAAGLRIAKSETVIIEPSLAFPRRNKSGEVEISDFILPPEVVIDVNRKFHFFTHKFTNFVIRISGNRFLSLAFNHFPPMKFIENVLLKNYLKRHADLVISEGLGFSDLLQTNHSSPYLLGLFQSYKWLDDSETMRKMQSLHLVDESLEFKVLRDAAVRDKPMVVHIRLGDYKAESDFGILSGDYYREAIGRLIGSTEKIWVFTNEEDLAREIFPVEYSQNVRWVAQSELSSSQTLELMRYGTSFVIGNSTFSWWAAILNHNNSLQVVAPKPWFKSTESPRDLIPDSWIQIEAKYLAEK